MMQITMKQILMLSLFIITMTGISCWRENAQNDDPLGKPIPIGENSFVFNEKVYKIINNELLQIGNLNDSSIRKLKISSSELKNLGTSSLSYVKRRVPLSRITGVYRWQLSIF